MKLELENIYQVKINTLKPYKILKFIIEDIQRFNTVKLFTLKEQIYQINKIMGTSITYNTYIQFRRTYINEDMDTNKPKVSQAEENTVVEQNSTKNANFSIDANLDINEQFNQTVAIESDLKDLV
jgi:hypothetical protein